MKKLLSIILLGIMVIGLIPHTRTSADDKPDKPIIFIKALSNGSDVKITIKMTSGADGYKIMVKYPESTKYKKAKIIKMDGTKTRTYTFTGLTAGKYFFKVKAYHKSGSKTIWGAYSKTKSIDIEKHALNIKKSDFAEAKTGDYITFGTYEQDNNTANGKEPIEWLVLSNNGDELYIMSKYALECKPFQEEGRFSIWKECTLRTWLNDEFYNTAFSKDEKTWIKNTIVKNDDNPLYGTIGGEETNDYVFLPSLEDMVNTIYGFDDKYEAEDTKRRCVPTEYAKEQGVKTFDTGMNEKEGFCIWLLRSPGTKPYEGNFYVSDVMYTGEIRFTAGVWVNFYGIRPALIIRIK